MHKCFSLLIAGIALISTSFAQKKSTEKLRQEIIATFGKQQGDFAVAFKNLQNGDTLFINGHEIFHAASMMKLPVLIEAYLQASAGMFALSDSIVIYNEFKSIADTSHFSLSATDDSEFDLYKHIGDKATLHDLLYQMITSSSNLATNIIIDKTGAANVTATLRSLGLHDITVLRGVEDGKAYEKGMNNTISAYDLAFLFEKIARAEMVSPKASKSMMDILFDQKFKDIIPLWLPPDVKVAHKTGFFTGVHHDGGIVVAPDGRKYVLVLLSKNLTDDKAGIAAMAEVSKMFYDYFEKK